MSKRIEPGCLALVVDTDNSVYPQNRGRVVRVAAQGLFVDWWHVDGMGRPLMTHSGLSLGADFPESNLKRIDGDPLDVLLHCAKPSKVPA